MPRSSATRRASYTSSIEQQRPRTCSGIPSCPARRRWFQSCIVRPTTLWPSARSMAATVEESTPPDMATAMVSAGTLLIIDEQIGWPCYDCPKNTKNRAKPVSNQALLSVVTIFLLAMAGISALILMVRAIRNQSDKPGEGTLWLMFLLGLTLGLWLLFR